MATKIYTKTGDKGQTSLIGGLRIAKSDLQIEAYGTVDELNSWIGLLRDRISEEIVTKDLFEIQDRLFTMGSALATQRDKEISMKLPKLIDQDIFFLEQRIDDMTSQLPAMNSFILPGGNETVSFVHIARCVCRRAERNTVAMKEIGIGVEEILIIYLNRLSDYLFVLARYLTKVLQTVEVPWKPRMSTGA